jgi:hypothetical protein
VTDSGLAFHLLVSCPKILTKYSVSGRAASLYIAVAPAESKAGRLNSVFSMRYDDSPHPPLSFFEKGAHK